MMRLMAILSGLVLLVLGGCGSSGPDMPGPVQPAGLLSPVSDTAAFEASIKAGLTAMSSDEQLALADAAASAGGSPTGNFTGTYTQELNVDEFDAVRYDGEHLFVAPRRYFHCCFLALDAGGPVIEPPPIERSIRILATDPANGTADLVSEIPLKDGISVQGMYTTGDTMVALTGRSIYGTFGELWADIAIWAPEKLGFRVYDVSDAADPALTFDATIDGVFVESRRIGNTVYIVSRYTPWIPGLHYYITTPAQQAENQALLASTTLDDLLPKVTVAGETRSLVAPERCYVTTDAVPGNSPVITSVTAIPIDNPSAFSTTCYKENAYGVYVSENALYFTEHLPATAVNRDVTRIHKFALAGTDIRYRGSADIGGNVWRVGQADFRMSEHNGDLRLLSSQFDWNNEDFVDHYLYVLRESSTRPELDIVSTLPNDRRPGEIGKPNEALYGVRFLGDVAYAVTFQQIDPLYAIDLSNPADPFIAGELEVTGFSDFLHPVTDDLLLGLGTDATGGVKLELFDVSNIAQPLSRGSAVFGGPGSYSEARWDRHAFSYQADVGGIDRFAIPANLYAADGSWQYLGASLYLFEIRDKNMPAVAALNSVGSISPPSIATTPDWVERSRSFIHNDTVYYIRDEDVWAASWLSPSIVNGPY
ncbi:MAG: beta-propeller domain-containing protein [Gammaproteobacteria bacterium]|nr:beta-propeller domain-containing protein [Gammaproteobacteria bacterium]MDH5304999.1 beta-propeller domain-containing protein [Gammaproteobacteria bacterium]